MRRRAKFEPVVFCDPFAMAGQRKVAVEQAADGTIGCVEWDLGNYCVRALKIEEPALAGRYAVLAQPVAPQAAQLKISALAHGATPEAVRLLGLVVPISKQEEATMAEKLKGKGAKSADVEGLKAAAKEAPVGGKKTKAAPKAPAAEAPAPKKRGNPEALAKARAERAAKGPDTRKIKVLTKVNPYREGSKAARTFELFRTCATVADVQVAAEKKPEAYDLGYLRYASRDEHIKLG